MPTITKKDLAHAVTESVGCKRFLAIKAVDILFEVIRETMMKGNRIEVRGFGVFNVKDTKPKPAARNPKTGEIIYVPARRKTQFKPGQELRKALHKEL